MLQGTDLVVAATAYTIIVYVAGYFTGKRNGSKADDLLATAKTDVSTYETRLRAVEDAVISGLNIKLAEAKADTAKAVDAVKQSLAKVEVKPETVAQAIVTEIKKVE